MGLVPPTSCEAPGQLANLSERMTSLYNPPRSALSYASARLWLSPAAQDFGLSAVLDPGASHLSNFCGGTMGYMAPEVRSLGSSSLWTYMKLPVGSGTHMPCCQCKVLKYCSGKITGKMILLGQTEHAQHASFNLAQGCRGVWLCGCSWVLWLTLWFATTHTTGARQGSGVEHE
jgi:serine/threonine protein kinase